MISNPRYPNPIAVHVQHDEDVKQIVMHLNEYWY